MSLISKIYYLITPSEQKKALMLLGLMVLGMLLETLSIGLVIPAVTVMLQSDTAYQNSVISSILNLMGNPNQNQLIKGFMLLLMAIYFFKNIFLALLAWMQTRFAFSVQVQLSQRLYQTYLRQPYTFHLQHNSAQLFRNISGEVVMFMAAIISTLMILTESLVVVGVVSLLLFIEPLGALVVVLVLGISSLIFYYSTKTHISRWGELRQTHEGLKVLHLQQGLAGVKDVKLLGRELDFLKQFSIHNIESARVSSLQATLQQFPRLWLELLAVIGLVLLVFTMLYRNQEMTSIVSTLGLFAAAAFRLMPSLNRILGSIQTLRFNLPVVNTLYEECKLAEIELHEPTTIINKFKTEITLKNISYIYHGATSKAVENLSFSIESGKFVGFIGSTGSGKSTLIDVILGLLEPTEGQVLVDGQDIQNNLRVWQDQIGYVPQTIYLTDDTIRRNVAFGLSDNQIDNIAVERAIKLAQLETFVNSLPLMLETFVGERGIRLSGGQRQRIGIARALYHDPHILVMDEATSALDTITEREVMQAVTALHGTKTVLIVAHRLSTVENCDKIYTLEYGKIVQETAPSQILLKQKKLKAT